MSAIAGQTAGPNWLSFFEYSWGNIVNPIYKNTEQEFFYNVVF